MEEETSNKTVKGKRNREKGEEKRIEMKVKDRNDMNTNGKIMHGGKTRAGKQEK